MAPLFRFLPVVGKLKLLKSLYMDKVNMATTPISTSSLAKLRKITGYSMSNCKKALEIHADDIERAEAWLHEEAKKQGWSKIANLQNRPTMQGLVAVCSKDTVGAMVEVNCETDFVARNSEFQAFVTKVLSSCLNHTLDQTLNEDCRKLHLDGEILNSLQFDSCTLGDLAASAVGKFGERTIIRRAVCFKTGNGVLLSSMSHPETPCVNLADGTLGRYGGLVAYRQTNILPEINEEILSELGHHLCQHIVGMNPQSLGDIQEAIKLKKEKASEEEEYSAKRLEVEERKEDITLNEEQGDLEAEGEQQNEDDVCHNDEKLIDSNETRLVFQQFLLDPSLNVGQYLVQNSLEVLDFQRFECGEHNV